VSACSSRVYALLVASSPLVGRTEECLTLGRALCEAKGGASRVLVVRGEAGVGKTALLERAIEMAPGFAVHRQLGVEPERGLGYAALHQLLVPFLSGLDELALPQRDALASAFGLVNAGSPDKFLVGLATLTLITSAALHRPLLCVIDDAHWLDNDSADVLGFVSRRLYADRVAMLFAVRETGSEGARFTGLPELVVGGLGPDDARLLVRSVIAEAVAPEVLDRLVTETRGNPLALTELPLELTPAQRAGTQLLPDPLPINGALRRRFLRQIRDLPAEAQRLVLLASAERSGDPALIWRAAAKLDIDPEAAGPAEAEGLVVFEPRVAFRHPLVRSAAYHGASPVERRAAHQALADALDSEMDADRRAWHRAGASSSPDEEVAAELARTAERATKRGGYMTAAAFFRRAAELTPGPAEQAERWLAAAEAELSAGEVESALELLELATPQANHPVQLARGRRLEARAQFVRGQSERASATLLAAAEAFAGLDDQAAGDTLLQAFEAALYANRGAMFEVVRAASKHLARCPEPRDGPSPTVVVLLLEGFIELLTAGHTTGAPALRRAIATMVASELPEDESRWLGLGCWAASECLDLESWHLLARRWAAKSRHQGAVLRLARSLDYLGMWEVVTGDFATAESRATERRELLSAVGYVELVGATATSLALPAWRGAADVARSLAEKVAGEGEARGEGAWVALANWALAELELGTGNYETAWRHAKRASQGGFLWISSFILPDLVEAAVRSDHVEDASKALEALRERAAAGGSRFARGILAGSGALLADDAAAEALYNAAIENLGASGAWLHVARVRLLYGEWLRRQLRRADARGQLRQAHQEFERIGALGFAERAKAELGATGETVRKRTYQASLELTTQEAHVARLVGEGLTNGEVAAQMFLSQSTIDYHLRKVFRKLGVATRTQMAQRLARGSNPGPSAAATVV
jgi:DNA-binding CsgD family transcriptional regulator